MKYKICVKHVNSDIEVVTDWQMEYEDDTKIPTVLAIGTNVIKRMMLFQNPSNPKQSELIVELPKPPNYVSKGKHGTLFLTDTLHLDEGERLLYHHELIAAHSAAESEVLSSR